jgi:hypothetical protein
MKRVLAWALAGVLAHAGYAFAQGTAPAGSLGSTPVPPASGAPKAAAGQAGAASKDEPQAQPTVGDDKDVITASEQWLKLLDAGKLGPAWDVGAPPLKSSVTRSQWIKGIGEARKPFGKVASRKAEKFARSHSLPGAPDGDYALLLFNTKFANGKTAQEHLTWMLDKDDVWRVSGYFIR